MTRKCPKNKCDSSYLRLTKSLFKTSPLKKEIICLKCQHVWTSAANYVQLIPVGNDEELASLEEIAKELHKKYDTEEDKEERPKIRKVIAYKHDEPFPETEGEIFGVLPKHPIRKEIITDKEREEVKKQVEKELKDPKNVMFTNDEVIATTFKKEDEALKEKGTVEFIQFDVFKKLEEPFFDDQDESIPLPEPDLPIEIKEIKGDFKFERVTTEVKKVNAHTPLIEKKSFKKKKWFKPWTWF